MRQWYNIQSSIDHGKQQVTGIYRLYVTISHDLCSGSYGLHEPLQSLLMSTSNKGIYHGRQ